MIKTDNENLRSCKVQKVIIVTVVGGLGRAPSDPVREITHIYSFKGDLIAKNDPYKENKK